MKLIIYERFSIPSFYCFAGALITTATVGLPVLFLNFHFATKSLIQNFKFE